MDKRNAILQATLDLIYEQGFHATPVSQIADRANVGTGSVYRYFKNKDDLLNQLYLEVKTRMHEAMHKDFDMNAPFETTFKRIWLNLFDFYITNPHEFSFAELYCGCPILTQETHDAGEKVFRADIEAMDKALKDGVIIDLPRVMIGAILVGTVTTIAKRQLSGVLEMTETLRARAAHAAWCAIRR